MKKKIFFLFFLFFLYYLFSLFYSFVNIVDSVTSKNSILLEQYVNKINLSNNIKIDLLKMKQNIIKNFNSEINITKSNLKFTGTMTPEFQDKIFLKMVTGISNDLVETKTMLYFYYNSKNLEFYFNEFLINLGDYNFDQYIANLPQSKNTTINKNNNNNVLRPLTEENLNYFIKFKKILIRHLIKYKNTDYFFLTSPIHFKLTVKHQDILFSVIFKFDGFNWKVNQIKIPFAEFKQVL